MKPLDQRVAGGVLIHEGGKIKLITIYFYFLKTKFNVKINCCDLLTQCNKYIK